MAGPGVTRDLARWIARADDPPSAEALTAARHAMLDWIGVTLAAAGEPDLEPVLAEARDQQTADGAPLVVSAARFPPPIAARINGTASHLLDFDDINKRMRGHPTVAVLPAVLACARRRRTADVLDALVAGTEVACSLGEMLGETHYLRGFHTTATVGTVAAAAAVCRLLAVDEDGTARALSLAATQAAGLRAMFATVAKPLHAGLAAERGVLAARWALAGLSAPRDGLEAPQGFGPVLSARFAPQPIRPDRDRPFGIEENVFKRHAACYYTHSAIEAALALAERAPLPPRAQADIRVGLQPALFDVCDIAEPKTGLEVKFSIRHLVAMALLGRDSTTSAAFTDALARDPEVCAMRAQVRVLPLRTDNRMLASVTIEPAGAAPVTTTLDVSRPETDPQARQLRLVGKFRRLAAPRLGPRTDTLIARLLEADGAAPVDALLAELVPPRSEP